ncbi:hypothetical protein B296_00024343 [Ensete ventricosum]|uniref:Uncharacterized protein n=1 Tax=Ensete ventricosum TaxID=4639 RepID=A0A427ALY7_ENSVE|nr:hypothetical protein B296_00024343 [Ensete ventricosum]
MAAVGYNKDGSGARKQDPKWAEGVLTSQDKVGTEDGSAGSTGGEQDHVAAEVTTESSANRYGQCRKMKKLRRVAAIGSVAAGKGSRSGWR